MMKMMSHLDVSCKGVPLPSYKRLPSLSSPHSTSAHSPSEVAPTCKSHDDNDVQ